MKLDISEYEFNVGDEVITIDGEKGKIVDICDCEFCRERGFLEPIWEHEDGGVEEWITQTDLMYNFVAYHKIGKYRFNDLRRDVVERDIKKHEKILSQLRKQLALIEELEEKEHEEES